MAGPSAGHPTVHRVDKGRKMTGSNQAVGMAEEGAGEVTETLMMREMAQTEA